jgi:excinuclease ABC subunit B
VLYADQVTASMRQAIEETDRRRTIQQQYNQTHRIVPRTVHKTITDIFDMAYESAETKTMKIAEAPAAFEPGVNMESVISDLEAQMQTAAKALAFEKAAQIRDRIKVLRKRLLFES